MNEELMTENIEISAAIVKAETTPGTVLALSDKEFVDQLEALARDIQHFERQAVFRIANRLAKAHELFRYRRDEGGFRGWVENRLDYSRSHAYRLLDVNKLTQSFPSWDTFGTLSASAIYLLAASSTPDKVRDEIADRVKAGEKISVTVVTEAIVQAKGKTPEAAADGEVRDIDAVDEEPSTAQYRAAIARLAAEDAPESTDEGVERPTETVPFPTTSKKKPSPLQSFGRAINWFLNTCEHAAELEIPSLDAQQRSTALTILKKAELALHSLAARLTDGADQAASDEKILRDLMLEEFFAQASGADIFSRIPAARLDEVIATFLDRLTVQGMCKAMSPEFRAQLRARLPLKRKPYDHTLNLEANSARNGRGTHSRH
jgi:hypothetical protein